MQFHPARQLTCINCPLTPHLNLLSLDRLTTNHNHAQQVSVAVLQSLDEMRAAVGEDMALASTLHVPAHHLLQCQAEAYGTPFK